MALYPLRGGKCECGGEIWEVREGVSFKGHTVYGPGRHVGWRCNNPECQRTVGIFFFHGNDRVSENRSKPKLIRPRSYSRRFSLAGVT